MSTTLKFRRGNTAISNSFIGSDAELFVNTDTKQLIVHDDGITTGGHVVGDGKQVIHVHGVKGGSSQLSGQQLYDAYLKAQDYAPGSGNRVTIIVSPGTYDLTPYTEQGFEFNLGYVDVVSSTGKADVIFDFQYNQPNYPGFKFTGQGATYRGITLKNYQGEILVSGDDEQTFENCVADSYAFNPIENPFNPGTTNNLNCTFINCTAQGYSFGYSNTLDISDINGQFINCTASGDSFGRGSGAVTIGFNAKFINCSALYGNSFGSTGNGSNSGAVNISGTFEDCFAGANSFGAADVGDVAIYSDAKFTNCTSNQGYSFGYCGDTGLVTLSGTFTNCISNGQNNFGYSYSGSVSIDGTFTDCSAVYQNGTLQQNSFGCSEGVAAAVTLIGTFNNCRADNNSFGFGGSISVAGTFNNCTAGSYSFGSFIGEYSVSIGGTFTDCTAGVGSFGFGSSTNSALEISGTFTNCIAGNDSFGSCQGGTITFTSSANFTNCTAGYNSFGYNNHYANPNPGSVLIGGIFRDCRAGLFSFGSIYYGAVELSGEYTNCTAGDVSFGYSAGGVDGTGSITLSGTFTDCTAGIQSFGHSNDSGIVTLSGTFTDCTAGSNSFGTAIGTAPGDVSISSTFINCRTPQGGNYSFGASQNSNVDVSGSFINCIGGVSSFGFSENYNASFTGSCTNCRADNLSFGSTMFGTATSSGTFIDCIGGVTCFGYGGEASGVFTRCQAGTLSFGVTASGTFTDCIAGTQSFGLIASGVFNYCIANENSFGVGMGSSALSGQLYFCRLLVGTFPTVISGGLTRYCVDGTNATDNQDYVEPPT
jgi:hypothetical protein